MRLLNNFLLIIVICASFPSNASISTYFRLTEQGYWYARAYNNMLSGCELSRLPLAISLEATEELYDKLSSAELICFFNGNLRTNHPALTKLAFWNYVKNRKNLKISKEDIESLTLDNSVLKKKLDSKKYLLEKIQKFWGGNENIHFYCFYSRLDEKSPNSNSTVLVIFSERAQLDPIENILPKIDDTIGVKIVYHNQRTYIFLKIDKKHSLENRINELFSIS